MQSNAKPEAAPAASDAVSEDERELDALAEKFFSQDSLYPCEIFADDESALTPATPRRAMHVALGMLAISAITVGGFLAYMHLIMPVPADLGSDSAGAVPTPSSEVSLTSTAPAQPVDVDRVVPEAPTPEAAPAAVLPTAHSQIVQAAELAPAPTTETTVAVALSTPRPIARRHSTDVVQRAFSSLNHREIGKALSLARQAVAQSPQRADAWIALGSAYDAMHDRVAARDAFRACMMHASGAFIAQCRVLARD